LLDRRIKCAGIFIDMSRGIVPDETSKTRNDNTIVSEQ
jgi:hypothetical protein